jgi:hypothetical protein
MNSTNIIILIPMDFLMYITSVAQERLGPLLFFMAGSWIALTAIWLSRQLKLFGVLISVVAISAIVQQVYATWGDYTLCLAAVAGALYCIIGYLQCFVSFISSICLC